MIEFFTYTSTGRIARKVSCPEAMVEAQLLDGEMLLDAVEGVDVRTHYVDVDSRTFVAMPPKPGEYYGFDYGTKTWVANLEWAEREVRTKRGRLLTASDWTQLPDVPLETKAAWATYRQDLRDITEQQGFPLSVVWPTAPLS